MLLWNTQVFFKYYILISYQGFINKSYSLDITIEIN